MAPRRDRGRIDRDRGREGRGPTGCKTGRPSPPRLLGSTPIDVLESMELAGGPRPRTGTARSHPRGGLRPFGDGDSRNRPIPFLLESGRGGTAARLAFLIADSRVAGSLRCDDRWPRISGSVVDHLPSHSPHPTPHSPLPTPHTPLPTPHTPHPTPHTPHPTPHSPLPTPHSPLPTPHSPRARLDREACLLVGLRPAPRPMGGADSRPFEGIWTQR